MKPTFMGKLPVATPGTPQQVTADRSIRAAMIHFMTPAAVTGEIAIGGAGLNRTTGAQCLWHTSAGLRDRAVLEAPDGTNSLVVADYWFDASVSGEGPLVTYWTR